MRSLTRLDPAEIEQLRKDEDFFWLDLQDVDDHTVHELGELFGYHKLALEDTREFGQRPKLDAYDDHVLIVWYGLDGDDPLEVHCYISGDAVVTLRRGHCDALKEAHRKLEIRGWKSEGATVYHVLDALTDTFYPCLQRMDDELVDLEDELFGDDAGAEEQRRRIFALRRKNVELRRIAVTQRDIFSSGGEVIEQIPGLDLDHAHDAFRDVHDHMMAISDQLDGQRELLSRGARLHSAAISNRVNESSKRLSIIATIFLPLTFVTGFFGQNFGWLTDNIDELWAFLVFGVGGLIVSVYLIYLTVRRSGALND